MVPTHTALLCSRYSTRIGIGIFNDIVDGNQSTTKYSKLGPGHEVTLLLVLSLGGAVVAIVGDRVWVWLWVAGCGCGWLGVVVGGWVWLWVTGCVWV